MPLITSPFSKDLISRLKRKINKLLKNGTLTLNTLENQAVSIGYLLNIQQLTDFTAPGLKSSSPEGIRVLLVNAEEVLMALDFYYKGKRLYFIHGLAGVPLENFVSALNAVVEVYRNKKDKYEASLVDFIFSGYPYLMIHHQQKIELRRFTEGQLYNVSRQQLEKHLTRIKKNKSKQIKP